MSMKINEYEKNILRNIKASELFNTTKELVDFSPRVAGTVVTEEEVVPYIKDKFERSGLKVRVDSVNGIIAYKQIDASINIVEPTHRSLTCHTLLGSGSTSEDGIIANLYYLGKGTAEDFEQVNVKDIKGSIILVNPPRGHFVDSISMHEIIKRAEEFGVVGVIHYSMAPGNLVQPRNSGSPTGVNIPSLCITYEDGMYLKLLLSEWYSTPNRFYSMTKPEVKLKIFVKNQKTPSKTHNVIGRIEGTNDSKVVVIAHYDTAEPTFGASDNSTGIAALIGIAKALNSSQGTPKKTIEIVAVGGEEIGHVGARDYVSKYKDKIYTSICLDIIGSGDKMFLIKKNNFSGTIYETTPWLNEHIKNIASELGYMLHESDIDFAADNGPFHEAGLPTSYIGGRHSCPTWPYHHSWEDSIEVINPNDLKVVSDIISLSLWRLANEESHD